MIRKAIPLLALALAAGCSSKDEDLRRFIAQTKQEQPTGIEQLPQIKPYDPFTYNAFDLPDPFKPRKLQDRKDA